MLQGLACLAEKPAPHCPPLRLTHHLLGFLSTSPSEPQQQGCNQGEGDVNKVSPSLRYLQPLNVAVDQSCTDSIDSQASAPKV